MKSAEIVNKDLVLVAGAAIGPGDDVAAVREMAGMGQVIRQDLYAPECRRNPRSKLRGR